MAEALKKRAAQAEAAEAIARSVAKSKFSDALKSGDPSLIHPADQQKRLEELAARHVQASWRGRLAKRQFEAKKSEVAARREDEAKAAAEEEEAVKEAEEAGKGSQDGSEDEGDDEGGDGGGGSGEGMLEDPELAHERELLLAQPRTIRALRARALLPDGTVRRFELIVLWPCQVPTLVLTCLRSEQLTPLPASCVPPPLSTLPTLLHYHPLHHHPHHHHPSSAS